MALYPTYCNRDFNMNFNINSNINSNINLGLGIIGKVGSAAEQTGVSIHAVLQARTVPYRIE